MDSPDRLRLAIVNDYEIVVAGVAAILSQYDDVDVVELDSRLPAVSEVDVVLFDSFAQAQGQDMDVDSLARDTSAKVVVFTWNTDPEVVAGALKAGATGYLSKGLAGEAIVAALHRVRAGEVVTPLETPMPQGDRFGRWPGDELGLTAREAEVMALICQGLSNQEIAGRLFLGVNTVKTYIRHLYGKIGVQSRSRAVLWGMEHGFRPDRSRHL